MSYLNDTFGSGGTFAQYFDGYEPRPGQVALATAVEEAMAAGEHLLAEGPCGTGKGIAYLVPATWQASRRKKRVVVVTAGISLQEQLVTKDLPTLQQMLPWKFSFSLLKGRNNYLCLDRLEKFSPDNVYQDLIDEALKLEDWSARTTRGDKSELPFVPDARLWSSMSVGSEDCRGESCPHKKADCYTEEARRRAQECDIVVTNYHMLFAHIMVRQNSGMDLVLPPFDFLVLDEAHEAVDVAREFFGFSVSEYSYRDMLRKVPSVCAETVKKIQSLVAKVFGALRPYVMSKTAGEDDKSILRLKWPGMREDFEFMEEADELQTLTASLAKDLIDMEDNFSGRTKSDVATAANRAGNIAIRLKEVLYIEDSNKVYWLEVQKTGWVKLRAKPIDVSHLLAKEIFEKCESVTVTSATVTTMNRFDFIRQEMGIEKASQLVVDTPFNFAKQSMLVIPPMPDQADETFDLEMVKVLQKVIMECGGRTMGLFTSNRRRDLAYEHLKDHVNGHRLLVQGQLPNTELVRIFKQDVNSILLGTASFWTGVDVSGDALTGLVIDRLPFGSPKDPIVAAINDKLGDRAFFQYLVPTAIIALRQGVGRLIRSKTDYGVIVVLDNRLVTKGYGKRFTKSLPRMYTTDNVGEIGPFLRRVREQ